MEEAEPQIYDALDESDDEMHDAAARAQQKRHSAREYVKFDEEAQGTTAVRFSIFALSAFGQMSRQVCSQSLPMKQQLLPGLSLGVPSSRWSVILLCYAPPACVMKS